MCYFTLRWIRFIDLLADDGILLNAEEQTDNDDVIRGIKFELIEKLGSGSFGEASN